MEWSYQPPDLTDEELDEVLKLLLQRLPKIVFTWDDAGELVAHLIDCPIAATQKKHEGSFDTTGPCKRCHCMPKRKDAH